MLSMISRSSFRVIKSARNACRSHVYETTACIDMGRIRTRLVECPKNQNMDQSPGDLGQTAGNGSRTILQVVQIPRFHQRKIGVHRCRSSYRETTMSSTLVSRTEKSVISIRLESNRMASGSGMDVLSNASSNCPGCSLRAVKPSGRAGVSPGVINGQTLDADVAVLDFIQTAIQQETPFSNQENPVCQGIDILHIMRGQNDGRTAFGIDLTDEGTDSQLGNGVQPDGRLVQKERFRPVQQSGRNFTAHPLPERKLARRRPQQLVQRENPVQFCKAVGSIRFFSSHRYRPAARMNPRPGDPTRAVNAARRRRRSQPHALSGSATACAR